MRRLFFLILIAVLLSSTRAIAQQMYRVDGKVFIDFTKGNMPESVVTNVPKFPGAVNNYNPVDEADEELCDEEGVMIDQRLADNTDDGLINTTVYRKVEVAPHDMDENYNFTSPGVRMTWSDAFIGCKSSTYDNGGWRLPTQKELMHLWLFKPAFDALLGELPDEGYDGQEWWHWPATESRYNQNDAYAVDLRKGNVFSTNKMNEYKVRCVREVTD